MRHVIVTDRNGKQTAHQADNWLTGETGCLELTDLNVKVATYAPGWISAEAADLADAAVNGEPA